MAQERSYDKQSGLQNKIQNLVLDTEDEKSSISHSLSAGMKTVLMPLVCHVVFKLLINCNIFN